MVPICGSKESQTITQGNLKTAMLCKQKHYLEPSLSTKIPHPDCILYMFLHKTDNRDHLVFANCPR